MKAIVLALALLPQQADDEFQKKVDAAIDKGVQWLLAEFKNGNIG